jgi:hypothetical protein
MTNSRVDVLVATPPAESRTVHLRNTRGEDASVAVQLKPDHFSWTLTNLPEASYFLLYGCAEASTVKVNGEVLPKSTAVEHGSMPIGWEADLAGNRLVIRLETRQVEQSTPTTTIEVGFNLSKK